MENNIKITGLILKTSDYKENDKIATIFTLEHGKINSIFKGVKKPNAKLKMAAQPFCFGDFLLVKSGDIFVTTNCMLTESFYDLAYDLEKFYSGYAILETLDAATLDCQPNNRLFIESLKALKELAYGEGNGNIIASKYMISALEMTGYKMSFSQCASCGAYVSRPFFSYSRGGMLCPLCAEKTAEQISINLINNLKFISNSEYDKLSTIIIDKSTASKIIHFIGLVVDKLYDVELKSLNNIL